MRIAAISDFHIGSTEQSDCFRHDLGAFHSYLDELEEGHDRIVLLGDIFQAEYGPWLGRRIEAQQLATAQRRVPCLWQRFQGRAYDYLHGNHDAVASSACGARTNLRIAADGFAAYFIHGHQFDPLQVRAYPLARASTWLTGRMRRVGAAPIADWLEHQDVAIKHRKFQGTSGPYALAASDLLRAQKVDVVVMGHTHIQQRCELAAGVYANTGTCSHGNRMAVSIDTVRRTVECLRDTPERP